MAGPNENILSSDSAIDEDFRSSFKKLVYEKLEDVPEDAKDWHPKSDNQALVLVHPSSYPLQYCKTLVVTDKAYELSKEVVLKDIPKFAAYYEESNFQWLPSVFHVLKKTRSTM